MVSFFQPAIKLMNHLKYPQKFALVSTVLLLPLFLVLVFLVGEIHNRIHFAQREIDGTAYLRPLISFSQTIYLARSNNLASEGTIEQKLQALEAINRIHGNRFIAEELFTKLKQSSQELTKSENRDEKFISVIDDINRLRSRVGDKSNLILDPDLDSYYLMDASLIKLPAIQQTLSDMQVLINRSIKINSISPEDYQQINSLAKVLSNKSKQLDFNLATGFNNNPKGNLRPLLSLPVNAFIQRLTEIDQLIPELRDNTKVDQLKNINDLIASNLSNSFSLWQNITDELDVLLASRIEIFRIRLIGIIILVVITLVVVTYLFIGFYQSVMITVKRLEDAAQYMAEGNGKAVILDSKDELAQVVKSFNRIANTLVATEAKFRSIFENSIDGIFQTTPTGAYLSANPALAKLYGYESASELIQSLTNLNTQLYVENDRRQEFQSLMARDGKVTNFESEVYRRDGTTIWISENARAVTNAEGEIIYYEGTVTDITPRKQAEAELAQANQQIQALNAQLKEENSRMRGELSVARKLQQLILPKEAELREIRDLEIAGFMQPADEVGGDYYDVLQQGGRLKIGIGDVTGHGLESGMVMLMVQMAVRTLLTSQENDPIKFLSAINEAVYGNVQRMNTDRNLTLTLIDYEQGKITLSGQHEEVILVRSTGEVQCIDTINLGFPIGLEEKISDFLDKLILHLDTDDVLVLYTDGITEAENSQKQFYGLERLCAVIKDNRHLSAVEIRQALVDDVIKHIDNHCIYDDITFLILKQK